MPHVTPVWYTLDDQNSIIIATDYKTKKLKNLKENPNVALLVDDDRDNKISNEGLMVQGKCSIVERGPKYLRLLKILFDRFETYRNDPWGEGESPILEIEPLKTVSWGIR